MKVASAVAALLLVATKVNAGLDFPAFFRGYSNRRRSLTNQQCLDETGGLFEEDSLMLAAFDAVKDEIEDKAACNGVELGKSTCEVDFDTFDTTEQFVEACKDMGGKTIGVTAAINCGYAVAQIQKRDQLAVDGLTFKYSNLMDCVSMECDDESVKDKIDGAIAKAASTLEASMSMDATCSYIVEGYVFSSVEGEKIEDVSIDIETALGAASGTESNGQEQEGEEVPSGTDSGSNDIATPGDGSKEVVKEPASSAQCRSLMTAAIGIPLLNMALAA